MRAYELAAAVKWAITEPWLRTIFEIAYRENPSPEAVSAQLGRPLENSQATETRDGVAIIPVAGPLFRYANLFAAISGATSIEMLALDFRRALDDSGISAILLNIDSPGGEVNGSNEMAQMIYDARGVKPVWAYIGGSGASAAYWLASGAERIIAEASAIVGSIGIIAAMPAPDARSAKEITFVSSQSPHKNPDPTTEPGRSAIQAEVDAIADVFISTVARHRGVTAETVIADFGGGGVFVGQAALSAGLVDEIGTFEGALKRLATQAAAPRQSFSYSRPHVGATVGARAAAIIKGAVMPRDWTGLWRGMFKAAEEIEQEEIKSQAAGIPHAQGAPGQLLQTAGIPQPGIQLSGGSYAMNSTPLPAVLASQGAGPSAGPAPEAPEVAELRKEIARERGERINAQAEAFASTQIGAGRAMPHEHDAIVALFRHAAEDDHSRPLEASEGQPASRVALIRATYEERTPHGLTAETVPGNSKLAALATPSATPGVNGATTGLTPERRAELLATTPLGQALLGERRN